MAKGRRGRNEGSIFQRTDGRWCASISMGHDQHGRRRRRYVYGKTKLDVQRELSRLASASADAGNSVDPGRQTVSEYLDEFMALKKQTLKRTTFHDYTRIVDDHLKAFFGSLRMSRLSPEWVEQLHQSIKSPFNRKLAHAILRSALQRAVKLRRIPANPCLLVDPPKVPKRTVVPVSVADVEKLLKAAEGTRYHALFVLAVLAGMRQGELFGLQVSDWKRKDGIIIVERSLTEVDNIVMLEAPKSETSRRVITLPQRATDALIGHLKYIVASGQDGFMFTGAKGKPLIKSTFHRRVYKPLFKKSGVSFVRFHDLRHTMASLLLQAGVHPKIVQERLGHSSISITMDTYSHSIPSLQREAADKLQTMFGT